MTKLFMTTFVLTLCALFISPIYTTQADYFKTEYTKQEVKELIEYKAQKYNLSNKLMNHIVANESSYNQYAYNPNDGVKGCDSRGLIQLNDCYMGKGIPDKLAFHPPYAIDKLALELKRGQCGQWSTCPQ
jgi:soluble lytic murein transglycosylase-like protein